jgi:hypothetical protein
MKKKINSIVALLLFLTVSFNAKGQTGLYMSAADCQQNKLTYEHTCNKGKGRQVVHLHGFFSDAANVTVNIDGNKYRIPKREIYGFRNCKGETYRFYKNAEYLIEEAGKIFIYSKTENIAQSKGFKVVNYYYFSTSPDAPILSLTYGNLRNSYHNNDRFLDLLDQYFATGEVTAYDNIHKTFKVNYVYKKALQ